MQLLGPQESSRNVQCRESLTRVRKRVFSHSACSGYCTQSEYMHAAFVMRRVVSGSQDSAFMLTLWPPAKGW